MQRGDEEEEKEGEEGEEAIDRPDPPKRDFCARGHPWDDLYWAAKRRQWRCMRCLRESKNRSAEKYRPRRVGQAVLMGLAKRVQMSRLTNEKAIEMCESAILKVNKALEDRSKLDDLKPRDAAVIMGIMMDKRRDLKGLPTQRVSVEVRQSIEVLMPALMEEAQRRGLIEGEVREIEEQADDSGAEAVSG